MKRVIEASSKPHKRYILVVHHGDDGDDSTDGADEDDESKKIQNYLYVLFPPVQNVVVFSPPLSCRERVALQGSSLHGCNKHMDTLIVLDSRPTDSGNNYTLLHLSSCMLLN